MSGAVEGVDPYCICCCRPKSAHQRGQCPETTYFIENVTTPPARSYADGVEDAAKVALKHAGILDLAQGHEDAEGQADRWYDGGKHSGHVIAAAIRLLSQEPSQ